jgi:hypothetical protein
MKAKEQVIFDIKSEKFKYLLRDENKIRNRVNVDILNKRLNTLRKTNMYSNAKMILFSLLTIIIFALISWYF